MNQKTEPKTLDQRWAEVETARQTDGVYRKQFTFTPAEKAIDEQARTVEFTITTSNVDRDNDTIAADGWELAEFLKNPVVLWAHQYDGLPIGRAVDVTSTANGLVSRMQFPPKGLHAFADTVFEMLKGGFLNAVSVGFKPKLAERNDDRGGIDFLRQSLLEYSVVPVPANADALIVARSKGIDVEPLVQWAEQALKSHRGDGTWVPASVQVHPVETIVPAASQCLYRTSDGHECGRSHDHKGAHGKWKAVNRAAGEQTAPAKAVCPECGAEYEGDGPMCDDCKPKACGADVVSAVLVGKGGRIDRALSLVRALDDPRIIVPEAGARGWEAVAADDPLRWNRSLSKAFDIAAEPVEPSRKELGYVSRWLGVQVQDIRQLGFYVPAARMGSFLAAFEEKLGDGWHVDALRNITPSGTERPPVFETIQLSSTLSRSFLVEGARYMRHDARAVKTVFRFDPDWSGIIVTNFIAADKAGARDEFLDTVWARSRELNFLKGEAFSLSGEFLCRGDLDWPAVFLEPKQEQPLRRATETINEQQELMASRGMILMGPPGTGKTLAGRVMLRQADATFIWVSSRDLSRSGAFGGLKYLFEIAAECAPTVAFLEDIDNWIDGYSIDLLKTEMDGIRQRRGILTVLTTNYPELLPAALIDRPGRFHDVVEMGLPVEAVRLRMLASWIPEASDAKRVKIAKDTDGLSGAHLRELTHFARTLAVEAKDGDIDSALERALAKIREQRELIASLRQPDYRPRRAVRMAVGQSMELMRKRGRVLSASNEDKIRTASQQIATANEQLASVLAQLPQAPPVDDSGDDSVVLVLDDHEDAALDPEEIRQALKGTIAEAIGAVVREQTETALARARGRVD